MKELTLVKDKIYHELVQEKESNVYDPDKFGEFCISAGAKKLFDTLLAAMTTRRELK